MIDLKKKVIDNNGFREEIGAFEVWFKTPMGLEKDLEKAIQITEELGLPALTVLPVPVAVSNNTYEVMN